MVGVATGQDDLGAEFRELGFEALGLGDATEAGHPAALKQLESSPFTGEDILEVQRVMDALDDPRTRVQLGDPLAQRGGLAVALGQEDDAGPSQVRRRLPQGATRQQVLVAEGLLTIDEHHVGAASGEFPILEAVIEQQGVAAEVLHRIAPRLDPVFVDQHHHVAQVRGEHVGFVAGRLGIEQEGMPVGDDPRWRGVFAEQDLVEQSLRDGLGA